MREAESSLVSSVKPVDHILNVLNITATPGLRPRAHLLWLRLRFHAPGARTYCERGRGGARVGRGHGGRHAGGGPAPPAPAQSLEGRGQARGERRHGGGRGRHQGVRREPVLLEPLGDQVGGGVVDGAQQGVAGGHGELGLQQHGVHGGGGGGVGEQLAEVLLVQARVKQVGVRVSGRGLGRAH